MDDINLELECGVPALPGGRTGDLGFVMNRAFECLGSAENDQTFMIVQKEINDAKNNVSPLFFSEISSFSSLCISFIIDLCLGHCREDAPSVC